MRRKTGEPDVTTSVAVASAANLATKGSQEKTKNWLLAG